MQRGTVLQLLGALVMISAVFLFTFELNTAEHRVLDLEAQVVALQGGQGDSLMQQADEATTEAEAAIPVTDNSANASGTEEAVRAEKDREVRDLIARLFTFMDQNDLDGASAMFAAEGNEVWRNTGVDQGGVRSLLSDLIPIMHRQGLLPPSDKSRRRVVSLSLETDGASAFVEIHAPYLPNTAAQHMVHLRIVKGAFTVFKVFGPI